MSSTSASQRPGAPGFTILELTVVMGLMSVFMMFLLQIVFTTTDLFQSGQENQETSHRSVAAVRPLEAAIRSMIGPSREDKRQASDARLIVQWVPIGFADKESDGQHQVLRATVRMSKSEERELLRSRARGLAGANADPEELETDVQKILDKAGYKRRGEMMLLAWPEGDAEGAYFDLRRGVFLADLSLPFKEAEDAGLMDIRDVAAGEFPPERVVPHTEVLATGLLHLSYRLASQYTEHWDVGPGTGGAKNRGPEQVWDSSRRGWSLDSQVAAERFSLDLGEVSEKDSTDDVFPHWIEVTVVAARSSSDLPEALLDEDIGSTDATIQLIDAERLPNAVHGNYLKIGSEWVRFGDIHGRTLKGVKRGVRGTRAKSHDRRTGVRAGKTEVMMIKILHGRDSWNG